MRVVDRIFGWLMVVSALLHSAGTLTGHLGPDIVLWSLGAGLGEALLAAINLLRVSRPSDRPLAWISVAGCLGWLAVIAGFAQLIHSFVDFRVVIQASITLVLIAFSFRSALASAA